MRKTIFTIDLDAFFASCEEIRNPNLKLNPLVIGKDIGRTNSRGVATTANYLARNLGVYPGMPLYRIRNLAKEKNITINIVEPDYEFYLHNSEKIFRLVKMFSPKIQISSIDECYLDVSEILVKQNITPLELAHQIQTTIKQQTNLEVSIGISYNVLLSKIASELKKPFGIATIFENEIKDKLWSLSVSKLYGAGKTMVKELEERGILTIGDVANLRQNKLKLIELESKFGKKIYSLVELANGNSNDEVDDSYHQSKSISYGRTYELPIDEEIIEEKLRAYFKIISEQMKYRNLSGNTVFIKVKQINDRGRNNKKGFTKQIKLDSLSDEVSDFMIAALKIIDNFLNMKIIHLTVGVGGLQDNYFKVKQKYFDGFIEEENPKIESKNENFAIKELIFDVNSHFNKMIVTDLKNFSSSKRFSEKKLNNSDGIKFKVWDKEAKK